MENNCYNCQHWLLAFNQCEMMNDPKTEKECFTKRTTVLLREDQYAPLMQLLDEARELIKDIKRHTECGTCVELIDDWLKRYEETKNER